MSFFDHGADKLFDFFGSEEKTLSLNVLEAHQLFFSEEIWSLCHKQSIYYFIYIQFFADSWGTSRLIAPVTFKLLFTKKKNKANQGIFLQLKKFKKFIIEKLLNKEANLIKRLSHEVIVALVKHFDPLTPGNRWFYLLLDRRNPFCFQTDWKVLSYWTLLWAMSFPPPNRINHTWKVDFFLPPSMGKTFPSPGWTAVSASSPGLVPSWVGALSRLPVSDRWQCGSTPQCGGCHQHISGNWHGSWDPAHRACENLWLCVAVGLKLD